MTNTTTIKPGPVQTLPQEDLEAALANRDDLTNELKHFWTIIYRHGVNATLTKNFYFMPNPSDSRKTMEQVIERAQKHCGIMGYKYHFVRPMVCDIATEEGIQLGLIDSRTLKPREQLKT